MNWVLLMHIQYKVLYMSFCALPVLLWKRELLFGSRAINQNFCSFMDVFSVQGTRVNVKAVLKLTDVRKVRVTKLRTSGIHRSS